MFSALKIRLKIYIKHFIYDLIKTHYEIQNWTRTVTCAACHNQIATEAHYCPTCGSPRVVDNTVQHPFPTGNFKLQQTDPLYIKPVSVSVPAPSVTRRFLSYVRNTKKKVGPDTIRHRTQQDLAESKLTIMSPQAFLPLTPTPYDGINAFRDTSKTNIQIPGGQAR